MSINTLHCFPPLRLVDHVDGDAVVVPSRLLDTVRGSPRLEVEGDRVCSREGLDGADSSRSPVVLDGVTVARYLGGALPDAHVHRVPGVLEPEVEMWWDTAPVDQTEDDFTWSRHRSCTNQPPGRRKYRWRW